jgi:signal transduction histidine kinase/CheY-like chemotaxis protein
MSAQHNKLLIRQLRKHKIDAKDLDESLQNLLAVVSDSYNHYEDDRKILERSNALSSAELEQSNKQLWNLTEDLECRVKERTQELETAVQVAREASESKSQFLANMSHEIRTPLNAIIGFSEILNSYLVSLSVPDEVRHFTNNIRHSGIILTELIDNILDLSRIEAGKLTISEEAVDLRVLLESEYHMHLPTAIEKRVELSYECCESLHSAVQIDRSKLNQILTNLTSNAIKFTPEGGTVTLRGWTEGSLSYFTVKDTGIGIPQNRQESIFESFEQADNSTTRVYGGSGLGLAISRKLSALLGGELTVSSEDGKGSTFTLCLPLEATEIVPASINARSHVLREFDTDAKILIVEDNPVNQKMILALFKSFKMDNIHLANNGREGVARAVELQPELIFMDMHMPEMDGLACTRAIRESPTVSTTPIVALSADAFSNSKLAAEREGVNEYIVKPIKVKELVLTLNQFIPKDHKDRVKD